MDTAVRDAAYQPSSKVKVEYFDPSSVFAQISPELYARLPLRNLNWNSTSRPLRSIDSLFVELVPDRTSSLSRPTSSAGPEAQGRRSESPHRERRHQIPGLRSTPYLKVYILRCDDSDAYKTSGRKLVREWIKANNLSPAKNSRVGQENHDAFEWLIIHVAPLEGGAWPTKAHTSVLEKLKSDFNSSSKSAPDHIAQIPYAGDFQVQGATADLVPAGTARDQFVQESNKSWDLLLSKLKTLILQSFDSRVRQYEEDIKEKSAQRHIPGWNFCTFFMLKEGLSIGFESAGLLDDALMGYDELSIELLSAMRDEENGSGTSLFRDHTQDLLAQAEAAHTGSETPKKSNRLSSSFMETDEKPYRELIMANNISVFDFRCYVFTRQVSVLTRMAYSGDSRDPSGLAEICRRAITFIASNSRTVRRDLRKAFQVSENEEDMKKRHIIIENIVATWTYSSALQILRQTEDPSLTREIDRQPDKKALSSSTPRARSPASPHTVQSDVFSDDGIVTQAQRTTQMKSALLSLASQRAKLSALARSTLKAIGQRAGWEYQSPTSDSTEEMDEVDLDGNGASTPKEAVANAKYFLDSLPNIALKTAVASRDAFFAAYEDLSWRTHNLYQYSEDENAMHAVAADIAALKFYLKDYSSAASYLHLLAPHYAEHDWNDLEVSVLDMYAWCLKQLDRNEDFARIALKLLAKTAQHRFEGSQKRKPAGATPARVKLKSVLSASKALQESFVTQLQQYFFEISTGEQVYHTGGDGFSLDLQFYHSLPERFSADAVDVRLIGLDAGRREINLTGAATVEPGKVSIPLSSKTLIPGKYVVDSISIRVSNIAFKYQATPASSAPLSAPSELDLHFRNHPVTVWPAPNTLTVTASPHPHIHLEQPRAVQVTITAGKTAVSSVRLQLRAATAGLRLHTAEATADSKTRDDVQPGTIQFSEIPAGQSVNVGVPYQLETDLKEITFRSDVSYATEQGSFVYGDMHNFAVNLPLGVNVQDIFQVGSLFSKFSITTSSAIPLRVLGCELRGTEDFETSTAVQDTDGLAVFDKQPVSMVYKTVRKAPIDKKEIDTHLLLDVQYRCLDEEVVTAARACLSSSLDEELESYSPLLSSHLQNMLKQLLSREDLTTVGLLREYALPSFSTLAWPSLLPAVPLKDRTSLNEWLELWHADNVAITLDDSSPELAAPRRLITIPVDVPPMPVLSTVSITVHNASSASPPNVGDVLSATLRISHTREWAQRALPEDLNAEDPLSFIYEIDVAADTWLLSGPRRKAFSARENEEHTFKLALIPQRAGHLLLPSVEVRAERMNNGGEQVDAEEELQCETHNESMAETVLVLPGTGQVEVGMTFDAPPQIGGQERARQVSNAWVTAVDGWESVEA